MIEIIARKLIIEMELEALKLHKLTSFMNTSFYKTLDSNYRMDCEMQQNTMRVKVAQLKKRHKALTSGFTLAQLDMLTKGEEIIGRFNPSNDECIDEIKLEAITLINTIDSYKGNPRRVSTSITDIEKATMMAVKSLKND